MAIAFGSALGTGTNSGSAPSTTATVTTSGSIPSAGRAIAVAAWIATGGGTETVSGGSLSWARDATYTSTNSVARKVAVWSAPCPAGLAASTVITTTINVAADDLSMAVCYITGADTSASYQDGTGAGNTPPSGGAAWATGTLATSNANDLLISMAFIEFVNTTATTTAPATEWADWSHSQDSDTSTAAYRVVSSTGSYSFAGTWGSGTQQDSVGLLVAYKAAAGVDTGLAWITA